MKLEWTNKAKNISSIALSIIMIIMLLIFTINYAFVDWEDVSENFNEAVEQTFEAVKCEIDYKDNYKEFHFSGFCTDKTEIFDFLNNITEVENER